MKQYVLKTTDGKYFGGYSRGIAYMVERADAILFPTVKEAENIQVTLHRGGMPMAFSIEEVASR